MIIDSHVHIGCWDHEWYRFLDYTDPGTIFQWIDHAAVFIPTDRKENDLLLSAIKARVSPGHWFFIPWIDPSFITQYKMFDWVMKQRNDIHGLKIHASLDKIMGGISNFLYQPIIEIALSFQLPILVHCGRWQETAGYQLALDTAMAYPDIKFILAHLGGDREDLKILAPRKAKEMGLTNVWFDISATREWWTIGMAIDQMGIDRIIFGSDFPVMHPTMSIASVKALKLNPAEEERIFSKNILEALGQ